MILQNFIVFEGIDGAGTSTQLDLLKTNKLAKDFLFTAEPTSFYTGKFLRQMLKGDVPVTNETAAYLFAADRNEHINGSENHLVTGVKEACLSGKVVVSDRYLFSSLAYQSINCSPDIPRRLNSGFPLPKLLFYFELSPKQALERIQTRLTKEIYEKESFLNKTVDEYHKILEEYAKEKEMKIIVIDATKSIDEIRNTIWDNIKGLIN